MAKIQTISLLEILSKPELTALGKFLKSPFFTTKKFLYPLFIGLRDGVPLGHSPNKKRRHTQNRRLSDLNACIEEFLIVQQALGDSRLRAQAELSALFGRKDENLFQRKAATALKALPATAAPEALPAVTAPEAADGWHLRFWIQKLVFEHRLTDRMKAPSDLLNQLDESIDLYYLICKLQLACNRASLAQFQRTNAASFQRLLEQAKAFDQAGKSALLSLYCATLRLLTEPNAEVRPFFKMLRENAHRLECAELESIVVFGLNYCIRRYRAGEPRAFKWYRVGFDWANKQQVWTTETVPEEIFLNTGVMFAKSHNTTGFESFLEKGKNALPAQRRDDAVAALQAYRYFYQDNFEAAEQALASVQTRHPRYAVLYHSLNVRNVYERLPTTASHKDLNQSLNSFEHFLQRQNLFAESFCESYHALIWFVRQMMRNGQDDALSKKQLMKELKEKQPAVPDWVADKIGGLLL